MMDNKDMILDQPMVESFSTETRASFIRKTYSHLALAFLAFVVVESLLLSMPAMRELAFQMVSGYTWLLVLGLFYGASTLSQKWAFTPNNKGMQYAGLGLYVVAISILFMPLMMVAAAYSDGSVLIKSLVTSIALFGGLSAVVLFTRKDFSFLRSALMIGGFIAMGAIVAGIVFGFDLGLFFSVAMVILMSGTILYQTSQMLTKYHPEQYVAAALGLFASFMTLLWYVIQIFMSRD